VHHIATPKMIASRSDGFQGRTTYARTIGSRHRRAHGRQHDGDYDRAGTMRAA
jgi:hypothetical protein